MAKGKKVEGLKEHRKGTDQGHGKSKPLQDKIPNIESRNPNPYPSTKKVKKAEWNGIEVTEHGDRAALKKWADEI